MNSPYLQCNEKQSLTVWKKKNKRKKILVVTISGHLFTLDTILFNQNIGGSIGTHIMTYNVMNDNLFNYKKKKK